MRKYTVLMIFLLLFFPVKAVMAYEYTLGVSLSLSEEYNDNIFLEHSDRKSDFITYLSPGLDFSLKSINSELRLGYSTSFNYYKSHSELNSSPAHNFTASGLFNLSERLSLTITDTYIKSSEIRDIRTVPDLGPVTGRIERTLHTVGGSISYSLRDNLSYTLGASYSDADYKEPGSSAVKTCSGNMGLNYRQSERTTLSANVRYVKYDYNLNSDATGQDYTLGVTYRLTPTLTVRATAGATNTKIEDTGGSDTGFTGGVDFTKAFEKGEAALSYRQSVIAGVENGAPLRTQTASLSLRRPITNKLAAAVSASYSKFESVKRTNVDTDEISFGADLTYNLGPWAGLALSYSYVNSDDKLIDTRDYYNHIIFLTLRLSSSRRL
jgi:hypothetical protein